MSSEVIADLSKPRTAAVDVPVFVTGPVTEITPDGPVGPVTVLAAPVGPVGPTGP